MAAEIRKRVTQELEIEGARIIFRNFEGRGSQFNREGDRNFSVVIDDANLAEKLIEDGWNIRIKPPREEGDEPLRYLNVAVKYEPYPPHIYMITGRRKVLLTAESVKELDNADIDYVDVVIRPYNWETATGHGVKAYCKNMYVVCRVDSFAEKYIFDNDDPDLPF